MTNRSNHSFSCIVAMDDKRGIGKNGRLPWHLPGELRHFKTITERTANPNQVNAVIMGRKTWESLPDKFRPLPNRLNCVLTRNKSYPLPSQVIMAADFERGLELISQELQGRLNEIFIIGGAELFQQALQSPSCQKIYLTRIFHDFACDTFFPEITASFEKTLESEALAEIGVKYVFQEYSRRKK